MRGYDVSGGVGRDAGRCGWAWRRRAAADGWCCIPQHRARPCAHVSAPCACALARGCHGPCPVTTRARHAASACGRAAVAGGASSRLAASPEGAPASSPPVPARERCDLPAPPTWHLLRPARRRCRCWPPPTAATCLQAGPRTRRPPPHSRRGRLPCPQPPCRCRRTPRHCHGTGTAAAPPPQPMPRPCPPVPGVQKAGKEASNTVRRAQVRAHRETTTPRHASEL